MKTKSIISTLLFISFFAITLSSCSDSDEGDTTKPVINLISPAENSNLKIGNEKGIHLEMDLSDNEELASYKIDIHGNFDGHGHKSDDGTVVFKYSNSWKVSGKNAHIHQHEIIVPDNATAGNYHLMVFCVDAAGNESYVARNIVLSPEGGDDEEH